MDFELDRRPARDRSRPSSALLAKHAGAERATALTETGAYDAALDAALAEAGFLEIALAEETGPLEAALVVEAVAQARRASPRSAPRRSSRRSRSGARCPGRSRSPIAGARRARCASRAHARTLRGRSRRRRARRRARARRDASPVASNFGYPLGRVDARSRARASDLGPRLGRRGCATAGALALAAETRGHDGGRARRDASATCKQRRQFGRAIGSLPGRPAPPRAVRGAGRGRALARARGRRARRARRGGGDRRRPRGARRASASSPRRTSSRARSASRASTSCTSGACGCRRCGSSSAARPGTARAAARARWAAAP